jgi:2-oxoglutarate ferredoxin oxidoreductase subunit delta
MNHRPIIYKNKQRRVIVFEGLCKGCGLCIQRCPVKAISFSGTNLGYLSTPTVIIDIEKCIACGVCELNCPDYALKLDKR